MKLKIKKLDETAVVPSYAKEGDAGFDLTAVSVITANDYIEYGTGLAVEIPVGHVGLIFPRSSVTSKDLMLKNSVGVIDCVPAGTMIRMIDGSSMDVKDVFDGKHTDIKSYNEEGQLFENDYIDEMWLVDGVNMVEIEDADGGIIRLPETKQIYTSTGWKMVKDLVETDLLLKYM